MLFDKPYGIKCTELIPSLADKEDKTRFISILNPTLQHYIELCLKHAKVDVSDFALLACEILCDLGVSRGVFVYNKSKDRYEPSEALQTMIAGMMLHDIYIDEDCDCKWVPVEYNGYVGYISTKYLSSKPVRKTYTSRRGTSVRKVGNSSYNRHGSIRHYTNSYGNRVQSPTYYDSRPAGATALCRDGSYSFSQSRRGTCSHHGGVARWY